MNCVCKKEGGSPVPLGSRIFRAAYRSCSGSLYIAVPRQPRATLPLYHQSRPVLRFHPSATESISVVSSPRKTSRTQRRYPQLTDQLRIRKTCYGSNPCWSKLKSLNMQIIFFLKSKHNHQKVVVVTVLQTKNSNNTERVSKQQISCTLIYY